MCSILAFVMPILIELNKRRLLSRYNIMHAEHVTPYYDGLQNRIFNSSCNVGEVVARLQCLQI